MRACRRYSPRHGLPAYVVGLGTRSASLVCGKTHSQLSRCRTLCRSRRFSARWWEAMLERNVLFPSGRFRKSIRIVRALRRGHRPDPWRPRTKSRACCALMSDAKPERLTLGVDLGNLGRQRSSRWESTTRCWGEGAAGFGTDSTLPQQAEQQQTADWLRAASRALHALRGRSQRQSRRRVGGAGRRHRAHRPITDVGLFG